MTNEQYIRERIEELKAKKAECERRRDSINNAVTWGNITTPVHDSDFDRNISTRQTQGWAELSPELKRKKLDEINLEIYTLDGELKKLNDQLFLIEYNKPENIAKREEETRKQQERDERKAIETEVFEQRKKAEEQAREERELFEYAQESHNSQFTEVDELVGYLKTAGMFDLADHLSKLRFVYSDYAKGEIDIRSRKKEIDSGKKTTKSEMKDIEKEVKKLSKEATHMVKKYKELMILFSNARDIVAEIKSIPGISSERIRKYFEEREYRAVENRGRNIRTRESMGYELLEFYRDSNSSYNEDIRKGRLK